MPKNSQTIYSSPTKAHLERTRFFPRQLIGPDDLTQDQDYFREKLRRHNRLLHGWGVVCGARVRRGAACEIIVEPGYILGPYGDEIIIDSEVTINLCQDAENGRTFSACGEVLDPWCSDVGISFQPEQTLYVAVRYAECHSRPVRVHLTGCGCDETACEYSRIRDGFVVQILTELPGSHDPMPQQNPSSYPCLSCPPCPSEPWVILADVVMGANDIEDIGFAHTRHIVSWAGTHLTCDQQTAPQHGALFGTASTSGQAELIAEEADPQSKTTGYARIEERPAPAVPVILEDGQWVPFKANFEVERGETYPNFLNREGDRKYYNTSNDKTYTLKELMAVSALDPPKIVHSVMDILALLEGQRLNVTDLGVVQAGLKNLLTKEGFEHLERKWGGRPAAVSELKAVALMGVGPRSLPGVDIANMLIGDIVKKTRQEFVEMALKGAANPSLEKRAGEVWDLASRVVNLGAWQRK